MGPRAVTVEVDGTNIPRRCARSNGASRYPAGTCDPENLAEMTLGATNLQPSARNVARGPTLRAGEIRRRRDRRNPRDRRDMMFVHGRLVALEADLHDAFAFFRRPGV